MEPSEQELQELAAAMPSGGVGSTQELRAATLGVLDAILQAPWVVSKLFIGTEAKRILQAQRAFWQAASDLQLLMLLEIYEKEP